MIKLRALEPDDIDLLFTVENDQSLWWVGNTNVPYSRQFLSNYILSTTGDIYTDKQVRIVIEKDSTPVGLIDLSNFDPKNMRAEIGIIIMKEYQNKGIAKEAIRLIEDYAANVLRIHQLYAIIPETNTPSLNLFSKCLFSHRSTLIDWVTEGKTYKNAYIVQKIL
jgi:diamine N-acetyltransferase